MNPKNFLDETAKTYFIGFNFILYLRNVSKVSLKWSELFFDSSMTILIMMLRLNLRNNLLFLNTSSCEVGGKGRDSSLGRSFTNIYT